MQCAADDRSPAARAAIDDDELADETEAEHASVKADWAGKPARP